MHLVVGMRPDTPTCTYPRLLVYGSAPPANGGALRHEKEFCVLVKGGITRTRSSHARVDVWVKQGTSTYPVCPSTPVWGPRIVCYGNYYIVHMGNGNYYSLASVRGL